MLQSSSKRDVGIPDPSYKWIALSNTTLGVLMASLNNNILLISLPAIFRGMHVNPMAPEGVSPTCSGC
jgi:hypothetical protein